MCDSLRSNRFLSFSTRRSNKRAKSGRTKEHAWGAQKILWRSGEGLRKKGEGWGEKGGGTGVDSLLSEGLLLLGVVCFRDS